MKRRNFVLLLGGASSGAMSVGTGAFSSVEAERGVEVDVVEDEHAYLGLDNLTKGEDEEDSVVHEGEETKVVKVTNQFTRLLSLSVSEQERDDIIETIGTEGPLEVGGTTEIGVGERAFVTVECETDETREARFTLSFSGGTDGVTVDKSREFTFTCERVVTESPGVGVKFLGNGRVKILSAEGSEVTATAYIRGPGSSGNGNVRRTDSRSVPVGKELKQKQRFGWENNGDEIVALEIDGIGLFTRDSVGGSGSTSNTVNSSAEKVFGDDLVEES